MTVLVSPTPDAGVDDGPAIAELHRLHAVQHEAFLADPYPNAETRQGRLMALAGMLLGHREQIRAAMSADFGAHPDLFTDLVEVLGVAGRAAFAAEQLSTWMAEDQRLVVRGTGDLADAFLPPYGPVAQAIVDSVFQTAAGPETAPGSG